MEREKIYVPSFGQIEELYKLGFGNDIDLALRNPSFRPLVTANENDVPIGYAPPLSDEQLLDTFVSKELSNNELLEITKHAARNVKNNVS